MNAAGNQLHQINVAYDRVQDRLLLRLSNSGGQEFRYWLTRRFAGLLGQALQHIIDWFGKQQVGGDPMLLNARQELASHQAVEKADLSTPYEGGDKAVSDEDTLLLVTINIRPIPPKLFLMQLVPLEGMAIDLQLDENLAHVMTQLLSQAAMNAEWNLSSPARETVAAAGMPNYRLH